jgi:hypothetical protein
VAWPWPGHGQGWSDDQAHADVRLGAAFDVSLGRWWPVAWPWLARCGWGIAVNGLGAAIAHVLHDMDPLTSLLGGQLHQA